MSENIKEEILRSEYWLDGIEEPEQQEAIQNFFRTQEKKIAIFLKARGFLLRGVEKKFITTATKHRKTIVVFCFDADKVKRAKLEYYNLTNPDTYNVNAKSILEASQDITSLIINS